MEVASSSLVGRSNVKRTQFRKKLRSFFSELRVRSLELRYGMPPFGRHRLSINLTGRLRTFGGFVGNGLSPRHTLLPEKGFFLKQKSRRDTAGTGSAPRQGGKGESSGTLPRPRKQPTGLFAPRCGGGGLFESSTGQHKSKAPCRDTARCIGTCRDSPAPSQTAHRAVCVPLRRERAVRILYRST